jgi:hypothetical protein
MSVDFVNKSRGHSSWGAALDKLPTSDGDMLTMGDMLPLVDMLATGDVQPSGDMMTTGGMSVVEDVLTAEDVLTNDVCVWHMIANACDTLTATRLLIAHYGRKVLSRQQTGISLPSSWGDERGEMHADTAARFKRNVCCAVWFECACRIEALPIKDKTKLAVMRLNEQKLCLYARRVDEEGNKIDDQKVLYNVMCTRYKTESYRYHPGVSVVGEYEGDALYIDRLFVELDEETHRSYAAWKMANDALDEDCFDDGGAYAHMQGFQAEFSFDDQRRIPYLVPAFGFMDSGHCIARSAQFSTPNPFLLST